MSGLTSRGKAQLNRATARYAERLVQYQPSQEVGYYQGKADRGKHQVQLQDGSMLYCVANTAGAIGVGDKVCVYRSDGGNIYFDSMP